ncbi:MAG TPA: hypothetical protein VMS73_05330 [Anaerolineaceae bacterium]|nr:hypothetical protein [Anaerolineaceae bacterium]
MRFVATKLKALPTDWWAILLAVILAGLYWSDLQTVPFHPDESTQIFMSGDVDLFFHDPSGLAWSPAKSGDPRQLYRLLDAPLTRWMIGIGREFTGQPALLVDWNWSQSWAENASAGALPGSGLLQASRLSVAWLFPFSLFLVYMVGIKISGVRTGFIALILLATNALVLLHTRRAMAESGLLFATVLALYSMMNFQKKAWLNAIPAALAFAAKQTGAILVIASLIVIFYEGLKYRKSDTFKNIALFAVIFLVITILLNPFLWSDPFRAIQAGLNARQDLLQRQVAEFGEAIPGQVFQSIPERSLGLVANLFFTPLQFAETGNYLAQTQPAQEIYLSNPLQTILRSLPGGAISLFLALAGLVLAFRPAGNDPANIRKNLSILLLNSILVAGTIILAFPLSFQRYAIPMVPIAILWIACGIDGVIRLISMRTRK